MLPGLERRTVSAANLAAVVARWACIVTTGALVGALVTNASRGRCLAFALAAAVFLALWRVCARWAARAPIQYPVHVACWAPGMGAQCHQCGAHEEPGTRGPGAFSVIANRFVCARPQCWEAAAADALRNGRGALKGEGMPLAIEGPPPVARCPEGQPAGIIGDVRARYNGLAASPLRTDAEEAELHHLGTMLRAVGLEAWEPVPREPFPG